MDIDKKTRIQFKNNEWMDLMAALNSAIVNGKKMSARSGEHKFAVKLQIARWESMMKKISERLDEE